MHSSSADHVIARRRARAVAAGLSGLIVAGGATAGVAGAAQLHDAKSRTYPVLSVVTTGRHLQVAPTTRTTELEYVSPHGNRYTLTHYYRGSKRAGFTLESTTWEKDTPSARHHRNVLKINVDTSHQSWVERQRSLTVLKSPPLGIRSSARQVATAIQNGTANPFGLTRKDGQRVRLLLLRDGPHELSPQLWVNPATDQPVAENEGLQYGQYTYDETSHWEHVTRHAFNQLRAKPKIPAGYSVSRRKR